MKVGIVGFAKSGKTTVFNALTGQAADVGFGSKDKANVGVIKVPDDRVDKLGDLFATRKRVYAEVAFVDVAGPDADDKAAAERGLDPRIVQHMRETDALVHVVRAFDTAFLSAPPAPSSDLRHFEEEIILTDLVQIEKRIERLKKEHDTSREKDLLEKMKAHLESEKPLRTLELSGEERISVAGFRFLSQKPMLALLSVDEDAIGKDVPEDVKKVADAQSIDLIVMPGRAEMDIAQLSDDEQAEFLADLGLTDPARDRFVQAAYRLLNLISFLTAGEDECRAWPIPAGTTAHRAAGTIHTDIEKRFIKATVVRYDDLVALGSIAKAREAGKVRLEGKEYVVHDGDVIEFQHNA